MRLPSGTVTFVFTDIEGSTIIWDKYPDRMPQALARHNALIKEAVARNGGHVFKTTGDGCCAVFEFALEAVAAALEAQRALLAEDFSAVGSLRVRMAVHTGPALFQEDPPDYFGATLSRVNRLIQFGRGGQIVLSEAAGDLARNHLPDQASLHDLGLHSLPDMQQERLFLLAHPALPADLPTRTAQEIWPNNLPHLLTSFVGRERQMWDIRALLGRARLLTLTGAGGCGKTRLALQVASGLLEQMADGVWSVELAPLSDPALIPQAVADALGVREEPGRPMMDVLIEHLKPRYLLLLLDNCEHLLAASARFATDLLRACPNVTILATSREGMGVAGELIYPVLPLSLPDADSRPSAERIRESEAVRLFVERATFRTPGFALTDRNAEAVLQICCRLDGIPLALELAAARLGLLSVEQLARFDDYFRLLTGGNRTGLFHHQTLQAALDWSYDLLSEAEQALFRQLSVFAGGWTLETAEQVCGGWGQGIEIDTLSISSLPSSLFPLPSQEILNLLSRLVDCSLVIGEDQKDVKRFRMLEPIRQYAWLKLEEAGEAELLRKQHLDVFWQWAEKARPHLSGAEQGVWVNWFETEHSNLRAALAWCLTTPDQVEKGLRIAFIMVRFWHARSHFSEGRQWCAALLAHPGAQEPTTERANVLSIAGLLASRQGDSPAAQVFQEGSLALSRQLNYEMGIARALNNLGNLHLERKEYEAARLYYEEALALNRNLGQQAWLATNLHNLGIIANQQGDLEGARSLYLQALQLHDSLGNTSGLIEGRIGLAGTLVDLGDVEGAYPLLTEALTMCREVGEHWTIPYALINLANAAILKQQAHRAIRLFAAQEALCEALGTPMPPRDRAASEQALESLRGSVGQEVFASEWAQGKAMSLEQTIAYALEAASQKS